MVNLRGNFQLLQSLQHEHKNFLQWNGKEFVLQRYKKKKMLLTLIFFFLIPFIKLTLCSKCFHRITSQDCHRHQVLKPFQCFLMKIWHSMCLHCASAAMFYRLGIIGCTKQLFMLMMHQQSALLLTTEDQKEPDFKPNSSRHILFSFGWSKEGFEPLSVFLLEIFSLSPRETDKM